MFLSTKRRPTFINEEKGSGSSSQVKKRLLITPSCFEKFFRFRPETFFGRKLDLPRMRMRRREKQCFVITGQEAFTHNAKLFWEIFSISAWDIFWQKVGTSENENETWKFRCFALAIRPAWTGASLYQVYLSALAGDGGRLPLGLSTNTRIFNGDFRSCQDI